MRFKKIDSIGEHYNMIAEIGAGNFGTVKGALHIRSGMRCAVKTIRKSQLISSMQKKLNKNEFEILEEVVHPHITRIFQLLEDDKNFYIVSELMTGGNLFERLSQTNQ